MDQDTYGTAAETRRAAAIRAGVASVVAMVERLEELERHNAHLQGRLDEVEEAFGSMFPRFVADNAMHSVYAAPGGPLQIHTISLKSPVVRLTVTPEMIHLARFPDALLAQHLQTAATRFTEAVLAGVLAGLRAER